jgi:hypothetical protein
MTIGAGVRVGVRGFVSAGFALAAAAGLGFAWAADGDKAEKKEPEKKEPEKVEKTEKKEEKPKPKYGYADTPYLPGGKWRVHDGERPLPPVVTPVALAGETPAKPPSDAIVLFDGTDLSKWRDGKGQPAGWKIENGVAISTNSKTPGGGSIHTADEFGDIQLHIEWSAPNPPKGKDQGRGNSGVFLMRRYEIQVLDCFENPTYADGHAGAVYGQFPPLANACAKPGEWNTYDILFTAPRWKDDKLETPAYVTVIHNGVVVQNHTEILGSTAWRSSPKYGKPQAKGAIELQDHGDPVRFRNIWVRELKPRLGD